MTKNDNDTTSLVSAETSHAVRTSFNSSPISLNSSLNFIESAKRSTNTVVHIYAEESPQLVQKKRQDVYKRQVLNTPVRLT